MIWIVYRVFGVETALDSLAVELVLLATVAVPLALGMGLARLYPDAAPRLAVLADRVGGVILLLVGHLLGGPDSGNRGALASATVSRHPAIALLLASGAFPEHESNVIAMVLLYLLAALLLAIPYERWRKSVASDQPHVANLG